MSKNLFCLYKNLNLGFTLFITCMPIDFPESVSSRMQPKYVTFVYCLIFISLYWIFKGLAFLILRLLLKRIDLVLSSPKWMLSLLSTNQSHIKLKFLLSWISIFLIPLCWKIWQVSSAYKRMWMCKIYVHCNYLLIRLGEVMNFETNLFFLIKPFFYMNKKWRQKFKYLENKKGFEDEIRSIFHHF